MHHLSSFSTKVLDWRRSASFFLFSELIIMEDNGQNRVTCFHVREDILKKNLNASRPSDHSLVRGKKCQNV